MDGPADARMHDWLIGFQMRTVLNFKKDDVALSVPTSKGSCPRRQDGWEGGRAPPAQQAGSARSCVVQGPVPGVEHQCHDWTERLE